jgi:hypothetical protein
MSTAFTIRSTVTKVQVPWKLSIPHRIRWNLKSQKIVSRLIKLTKWPLCDRIVNFLLCKKSFSNFYKLLNYMTIPGLLKPLSHILSRERQVNRKCPKGTSFRRLKYNQVQVWLQILLRLFGNQLFLWTYHKCFHHPFTTPTSLNIVWHLI